MKRSYQTKLGARGEVGDHCLEVSDFGAQVQNFVLCLARDNQPKYIIWAPGLKNILFLVVDIAKVAVNKVSGARVSLHAHP
jgi:hypothetical protein